MPRSLPELLAPQQDTKVYSWRLEQCLLLGFSLQEAIVVAQSEADLERVRALAKVCPLPLVAEILV